MNRTALGKVGVDVNTDRAREAARSAAINMLATIREALGTLDRVERVVNLYGVVNAAPDYVEHTRVIDAASDVLLEVFGDAGRHARLAVGVASLPANMCLEIQAVLQVRPAINAFDDATGPAAPCCSTTPHALVRVAGAPQNAAETKSTPRTTAHASTNRASKP